MEIKGKFTKNLQIVKMGLCVGEPFPFFVFKKILFNLVDFGTGQVELTNLLELEVVFDQPRPEFEQGIPKMLILNPKRILKSPQDVG